MAGGIGVGKHTMQTRHSGDNRDDDWEEGHTHAEQQGLKSLEDKSKVTFCDRLKNLTWAWFTLTMGTGGIALVLGCTPHRFPGLDIIGKVFLVLDLFFFISIVTGISARFIMVPSALKTSLTHPTESLFFPCFLLSTATILGNCAVYGGPVTGGWLSVALNICFWIYATISTISAILQFFILFEGAHLPIQSMSPAWALPIFPAMIVGTLAAIIAPSQPPEQRLPILIGGVAYIGLGLMVALLVYPLYLGRLMQHGLPAPAMRAGMFIPVGQMGYAALALIEMSRAIPEGYGYFAENPFAVDALRTVALWVGIWIWLLGFWFFAVSLLATLVVAVKWKLEFSLTWWAFIFPNVGFTVATADIGEGLGSPAVLWISSAMTVLLFVAWFLIFIAHVIAYFTRKIMWPGRD